MTPVLRHAVFYGALLGFFAGCAVVAGDENSPAPLLTATEVQELAGPYLPNAGAIRAAYQARVLADQTALADFLQGADGPTIEGLRDRLSLTQLRVELTRPSVDPKRIRELLDDFFGSADGLELGPVRKARDSLSRFHQYLLAVSSEDLTQQYEVRLGQLTTLLSPGESAVDIAAIAAQVAWLELTGQAPRLVTRLRKMFRRPNAVIQFSPGFVVDELARFPAEFTHSERANNTILGAAVSGPTQTKTQISPQIVDGGDRANLDLAVAGTVEAPANVAIRRPVAIYSRSRTFFDARKSVYWDGWTLQSDPTQVTARTSTEFTGADRLTRQGRLRRGRITGRIAMRRANRQRGEAESIASEIAESRVAEQIDRKVNEQLSQTNSEIERSLRLPLTRLDMLPRIEAAVQD